MAGRGRASVADMARVELAILQSIDAVEKRGDAAGFSRAWLAKQVGVSEWRIHAAISRLSEAGLLDQEVHFTEAGAQLPRAIRKLASSMLSALATPPLLLLMDWRFLRTFL